MPCLKIENAVWKFQCPFNCLSSKALPNNVCQPHLGVFLHQHIKRTLRQ